MERLPVIDAAELDDARLGGQVGEAARGVGFFYLTGHGIDPALMAAVFAGSAEFFALPSAVKARQLVKLSPHNRGYVGLREESLDPAKGADNKEAYNIGLELAADDPEVTAGMPFRGVNLWPDLVGWREIMLAYFNAVWALGRRLNRGIARDLGIGADFFEDKFDRPMATLRLLHYPAQGPGREAAIGAGEHTDYGNLTLLMTDEVGGLEVKRRDGGWIPAPHIPGAFICNIGDCLMRWTNDVYVSTPHRVVNRSGRERYSVAFFLDPNPDVEVACLPTCLEAGRPAKYQPVTAADFLRGRLDATYNSRPTAAAAT
jgi:isopenicillin N synthase-like dioxygenase